MGPHIFGRRSLHPCCADEYLAMTVLIQETMLDTEMRKMFSHV